MNRDPRCAYDDGTPEWIAAALCVLLAIGTFVVALHYVLPWLDRMLP